MTNEQQVEIVASVARLEGKIETLTARLDAHLDRTASDVVALARQHHEHSDKIEAIRVDYVPRAALDRHADENEREFRVINEKLDGLASKVLKASGVIAAMSCAAGWAASYFGGGR